MYKLFFLMFGLVVVSCGSVKQTPTPTPIATQNLDVLYNKWELVLLNGNSITTDKSIYLEFTRSNQVNGFAGCNIMSGEYVLGEGQSISFTNLITTYRYCHQADLEARVIEMLNVATKFSIESQTLMLKSGDGATIAEFTQINKGVSPEMIEL